MIFTFADRELDTATSELRDRSTAASIPLEPQVFAVLRVLVEHADRVVTKEELLDSVWGTRFVGESALTSRIKDARKAVGDDGRAQRVIRTVHGKGYRLVTVVRTGFAGADTDPTAPVALLERDQELAVLGAAVDAARSTGVGTVVLIAGEAGLGKTTLVRAFAGGARMHDVRVLVGGCDDLVTPRTMGPLRDIARELGGLLAAALDRDADPEEVFAVLPDVLAERPTVLVVEDLHWADDATLDVVRFLARQVSTLSTVLVGTYREEEVGSGHRLRRVLGSLPRSSVHRLALAPLSVDAVAALAIDAGISAGELHAVTGGNPFFVTEVLASGSLNVSPTVRDAVLSRIDALGPSARGVLEHAAVVPSRVERWLLAELVADADAAVAEAERAGVLGGDERFTWFRHELARHAVEQSLTAAARRQANQRVLQVLGEHECEPTRLVHHAHQAGDVTAVIRHCPVAADEAIRLGAYSQAIHLLELLLEHADQLSDRVTAVAHSQLAYAFYMVNRFTESADHGRRGLATAEAAGDQTLVADALLLLTRTLYWSDGPRAAATAVERALPILESLGDEVRVATGHIELARAHSDLATVGPVAEPDASVVEHADRAVEVAERLGHHYLRAHALQYRGTGRIALGDRGGIDDIALAVELTQLDPRNELPARACVNAAGGSYRAGHLDAAEHYVRLGLQRVSGGEFAAGVYRLELTLQGVRLSRGLWDDAEDGLRMLVDWPGEPGIMRQLAASLLARLLARQAHHDAAAEVLQPALHAIAGSSEIAVVGPVTAAAVETAWLASTHEDLPGMASSALTLANRFGHRSTLSELTWVLRLAGHEVAAPPAPVGPWAPALAGRWQDAATAWEALGARYERAVELAIAPDDAAAEAGRRELLELGAAGTLAALR